MYHLSKRPSPLALLLLLALGLIVPALGRPALAAQSFENTADIVFSDESGKGPALAPSYPSTIAVSNLKGSITRLRVTLTDVRYDFWDNLDILLVGPDGTHVLLMSDVGGSTNTRAAGLTLSFDDGAAALPDTASPAITPGGTYRPTNFQTTSDVFDAPAPSISSFNTSLAAFKLKDPNGSWRLFAVEDDTSSAGSIGAWSLSFETADLEAEVGAVASVNAGSTLTYAVTARNHGTEPVANPQLTIAVPAGTAFASATPAPGWTCPTPAAGQPIACTVASFASGAVAAFSVSVAVDKALVVGTTLTRTAAIQAAVQEADTANNSDSDTTAVTTLADLQVVDVSSPATVNAGARMQIDVAVRNVGPSNAAAAAVVIAVPGRTTYVSVTSPEGWSCAPRAAQPAGSEVACTRDVFATGDAAFSLFVDVDPALPPSTSDPATRIAAAARIGSATSDGTSANDAGGDTTAVATLTDLGVAVSDSPDPVSSAALLSYTIAVTNNGPSNAAAASMSTAVELGTAFVALEPPAGWSCGTVPVVGGRGPISCTNPSFGVGRASFTLKVRVLSGISEGETLALNVEVDSSTTDSDGANDTASETTTATIAADLSVAVDGVGPLVASGATLTYNIKVNNSGPEAAEGVSLTTATPANTTFVALDAPAGWTCGTVPAAGGSGAIVCANPGLDVKTDTLVLTVRLGVARGGDAVALTAAVATSANTDKNPANDSATLSSRASTVVYLPLVRR